MNTLDTVVTYCAMMFAQEMELCTNLEEDLNLQKMNTDVREKQ